MSRRIAIVGSRSICNEEYTGEARALAERDWMFYHLDKYFGMDDYPTVADNPPGRFIFPDHVAILSGGAVGVDRRAQEYANENGIPFFLYKPYHLIDTKVAYEPRYFFTRNKQIVDNSDEMIAFWDGESNGTNDAIRYARKRSKSVTVIEPDEREILEFA